MFFVCVVHIVVKIGIQQHHHIANFLPLVRMVSMLSGALSPEQLSYGMEESKLYACGLLPTFDLLKYIGSMIKLLFCTRVHL